MRKRNSPVSTDPGRTALPADSKWFMVTDPIAGYVNNKTIKANRGDMIVLSTDAAKLFKDRILEIDYGLLA